MLFGKMAVIRLFSFRVAINLQFVKKKKKKAVSAKYCETR